MMHTFSTRTLLVTGLILFLAPAAIAVELETRTGWLSVAWGDPPLEIAEVAHLRAFLTDDDGETAEVELAGLLAQAAHRWHGQRVEAIVEVFVDGSLPRARSLRTLATPEGATRGSVTGSQPWVSILCKFSDKPAEPENLAFFQNMYANVQGGLDHYWRELSYDTIDVVGSIAVDWVTLPNPQTFYIPTPGSGTTANLGALFADCTAAADPFVDFSNGGDPFEGINMMFNDLLDCCAWGGGISGTLDGVFKVWRTTWNPPWAFAQEGVIAHEMGHGFGLPHSNNWDNDGNPYDSPWDVMSAATSYAVSDPTYGNLGKHIHAHHKDVLGWIPPSQRFEAPMDSMTTITLDALALASTSNYRMARIAIPGTSRFYTVETRIRIGGYDGALPGDVVIISEVNPSRGEPIWVYDSDVPPATFGDNEGSMWRVGEIFTDAANNIQIEVLSSTTNGFDVRISNGDVGFVFSDGFESGDTTSWSSQSP